MSVSFEDFLKSAKELLDNSSSTEIDFRNLISRSYYALFHLSKQKAITLNLPIPTIPPKDKPYSDLGSHEKIFVKFEKHSETHIRALGRMMYQRKECRRKADYEISDSITKYQAQQHFYAIEGIIQELEQLKITP
jgi:uncharacterized protein (UPF0332 family)